MPPETLNTPAATEQTPTEPTWAKDLREAMVSNNKHLETLVNMAQTNVRQQQTPPEVPPVEPEETQSVLDDANLELLPRRELMRRLEESFDSRLTEALKPLAQAIDNQTIATQAVRYERDAIDVARSHRDFPDWEKEMMQLAEVMPNAPIGDIYLLARAKNPGKAAELDKKYTAEPPKTETAPAGKPAKRTPLTITPASGNAAVTNQRMAPEEAAQDAWDKSVAMFGNVFQE